MGFTNNMFQSLDTNDVSLDTNDVHLDTNYVQYRANLKSKSIKI